MAKNNARIGENRLARIAAALTGAVCWTAPLVPAVWINLDAAKSGGNTWGVFAVASVVFGAVCVENAIECRGVFKRALFGFLASFFLVLNVFNALGNAAANSEHGREDRTAQIREHARIEQQRSQWSQGRKEQVAIAGNATPDSIEAELQAAKAAEAGRWQATNGCNVEKITTGPSRAFCSNLAGLAAKKAAAIKRDDLDVKLAGLDSKDTGAFRHFADAAPESADPFAANVAQMLGLLGYSVTDEGKVLIASLRDWGKAVGVELLAGFGPTALLMMLGGHETTPGKPEATSAPSRKASRPIKGKTKATIAETARAPQRAAMAVLGIDADLDAFVDRRLEFIADKHIPAGQLFQTWKQYCAEHGRVAGSAKGFSIRIRKLGVSHEPNNGRPRYVGVSLKGMNGQKSPQAASLRLVKSN